MDGYVDYICLKLLEHVFNYEYLCRERSRAYGAAVTKIERCCPNILRKRSRGDGSSNERSTALLSGGLISKMPPQGHLNADDTELVSPRGEERIKNAGQNRRLRTSMSEVMLTSLCIIVGYYCCDNVMLYF
jgi:hypothetical protein